MKSIILSNCWQKISPAIMKKKWALMGSKFRLISTILVGVCFSFLRWKQKESTRVYHKLSHQLPHRISDSNKMAKYVKRVLSPSICICLSIYILYFFIYFLLNCWVKILLFRSGKIGRNKSETRIIVLSCAFVLSRRQRFL